MVERGRENLKDSGEGEALGASGGEEAAADAWGGCAEGDGVGREISIGQSEATRLRVFAARGYGVRRKAKGERKLH
jgi:hypothetical protein